MTKLSQNKKQLDYKWLIKKEKKQLCLDKLINIDN